MREEWTPRSFQRAGINWILELPRCALFASMGAGKTVMVLTAYDILRVAGIEHLPMLVVGPLRVAREVWSDEAAKWIHLRDLVVSTIVGTPEQRRAALATPANVYTCNFENIEWLIKELNNEFPYGMVVVDESSKVRGLRVHETKKKNLAGQGAARPRALAKWGLARATRWVNLTGTPAPNGYQSLWAQTFFLDYGHRLGHSYTSFTRRWFRTKPGTDGYAQIEMMPHSEDEINAKLKDICLTIQFSDYYDIGQFVDHTLYVDLPGAVRKQYREMEKKLYTELKSGEKLEAFNAGVKSQKLLQLCSGAAYLGEATPGVERKWEEVHAEKIAALESIVEEAAGMPILVAYHFKSDLARLLKAFPAGRHFDSSGKEKQDFIDGKIPLLFIHPMSGGHGVDGLQHATNIIVFFSQEWNLETYDQVSERIGPTRQFQSGYKRAVLRYHIVARNTIDEVVMKRRKAKGEVQQMLLDYLKRKENV